MPYFDHNATTPLCPAARETWLKVSDEIWHNPSSPFRAAARARLRLDSARAALATLLGCEPARIVFTSGATEAAHAIVRHLARTLPADAQVWVNPTEHPCVLAAVGDAFSGRSVALALSADGVAEPSRASLTEQAGAVIVMAANNETGVLQPWDAWREACGRLRVPFVCDGSQWLGKLPAGGLGEVDWVFGAGHKFGGPKGVGFIKLPAQAEGFRVFLGGGQESGHRAGTEDVAGIAAMVAALVEAEQKKVFLETDRQRMREGFERTVMSRVSGTRIIGAGADRLWNTLSLVMPHGENTRWVAALDKRGFQVSTGSACATGKEGPSHVLAALGVAPDEARRVVRISAGWETTSAEWDALADAFAAVDAELKASAPANVVRPL
jgi:cysteine desulfurase